jgi:hypothetical protein
MANTFIKIDSYTVPSGGVASYTFSNIPQTYTDLCVVWSGRGSRASFYSDNGIKINNTLPTNGINYQVHRYYNGTPLAYTGTDGTYPGTYDNGGTSTANLFSGVTYYFYNYTSSNYKKIMMDTVVETDSVSAIFHVLEGDTFKNTSAITSLVVFGSTNNYTLQQNSTYTLYGIKNS